MMKSTKILCLAAVLIALPVTGFAQLPIPPGPTTTDTDFLSTITTTTSSIANGATKASKVVEKYSSDFNSVVKQGKDKVGGGATKLSGAISSLSVPGINLPSLSKKKGEPNIEGAREIVIPEDEKTEEEIIAKFQNLFLKYPIDMIDANPAYENNIKEAYRKKATDFNNGSITEMYLVVRKLEARMNDLKTNFDKLSACFTQGQADDSRICADAEPNTNDLSQWRNYLRINVIYDQMLQITEELYAIKAQYEVAQALRGGIVPMDKFIQEMDKENESSDDKTGGDKSANADDVISLSISYPSSYAQIFTESAAQSEEEAEAQEENIVEAEPKIANKSDKNNAFLQKYNIVEVKSKAASPFKGTEKQFASLAQIANAQAQLNLARDVHNLKQSLSDLRKPFFSLEQMRKLHEKSVERLMESEGCVLSYLDKHYAESEKVWLGSRCFYSDLSDDCKSLKTVSSGDALYYETTKCIGGAIECKTGKPINAYNLKHLQKDEKVCAIDRKQICKISAITEYDKRQGFSGWLVSAYQTAKAEKALNLTTDDLSPAMVDENASTDIADSKEIENKLRKEAKSGLTDSAWASPSKGVETEIKIRDIDLLPWQIGAEGAKALGVDMVSQSPEWGKATAPYSLWKDEKIFYDQYLKEKYRNMRLYIQDLDMRKVIIDGAKQISNSLSGTTVGGVSLPIVKSYNSSVLGRVPEYLADTVENEEKTLIEQVVEQNNVSLKNMKAGLENKISDVQRSKDAVYKQLDAQTLKLNDDKLAYNQADTDEKSANMTVQNQKMALSLDQQRKNKSENYISDIPNQTQKIISEANNDVAQAQQNKKELSGNIENRRDTIGSLNSNLDNLNNKIDVAQSDYAREASALEHDNFAAVREAVSQMYASSAGHQLNGSAALQKAIAAETKNPLARPILQAVVSLADDYAIQLKQQLIERIDEAYEEIEELEDVHNPKNHAKLVDIHNRMINDFNTAIKVQEIKSVLPIGNISSSLSALYGNFVIKAICQDDYCHTTDTQYFVGLPPKARDFTAPKAIVETYTAPLREIVHFDMVDYDNVSKSDDAQMTTRAAFLDYGQDIPQIWKRILSDDGFVERAVDVEQFLDNNDGAGDVLLRGGTYPCAVGPRQIDFKDGQFYVSPLTGTSKICRGIKSVIMYANGSATIMFEDGERTSARLGTEPVNHEPSELSLLLKNNNGLTMSDKTKDIVEFMESLEDDIDEDSYGLKGKIYQNALLTRNQLGNYLNFVETEKIYDKALDDIEIEIYNLRDKINEQLAKIGIDLVEDYGFDRHYDLADEETYNQLLKILDERKNKVLNYAVSLTSTVTTENDTLKESKAKLQNLIGVLQMDKEELVSVSNNDKPDAAFSEKIKRQQTDNEAMDKYRKEADEAYEKQLNSFEQPYCAVY